MAAHLAAVPGPPIIDLDKLAKLADEIRTCHEAAIMGARTAVMHAMHCG